MKTRPDIARRRERQRDWEYCHRTRKRKILRSDTHFDIIADESKESLYDARRTETCVTPTYVARRHVDASREFRFFSPNEQCVCRGGGGALPDIPPPPPVQQTTSRISHRAIK